MPRHCWLRLKLHDWESTGAFSVRWGPIVRCVECGRMTATTNRFRLFAAEERHKELDEEAHRNPHVLHIDDPEHYDERGRYKFWGE